MKKITNFLKKLVSNSTEVSSKRFIGLCSFAIIAIITIYATVTKTIIPNQGPLRDLTNILFMITAATIIGGSVENVIKTKVDGQIMKEGCDPIDKPENRE